MLMQELTKGQPFWMLVGCILLNRTRWASAKPVLENLMIRYTPESLAKAELEDIVPLLTPLGLQNERALHLIELASCWLIARPANANAVRLLPGCGKYASDSWAIFVEGRTDVEPTDEKLKKYLEEKAK